MTKHEYSNNIFAARYVARSINTEDILRFADSRLSEGVYSDYYLSILDEEQKNWASLGKYLELAFRELGILIPSYEDAIWQLVEYHIDLIISEETTPTKGFQSLLNDIGDFDLHKNIKKYVGDNIGIAKMFGCYYSLDDGARIEDVNVGILEECIKWKNEYGKKH